METTLFVCMLICTAPNFCLNIGTGQMVSFKNTEGLSIAYQYKGFVKHPIRRNTPFGVVSKPTYPGKFKIYSESEICNDEESEETNLFRSFNF